MSGGLPPSRSGATVAAIAGSVETRLICHSYPPSRVFKKPFERKDKALSVGGSRVTAQSACKCCKDLSPICSQSVTTRLRSLVQPLKTGTRPAEQRRAEETARGRMRGGERQDDGVTGVGGSGSAESENGRTAAARQFSSSSSSSSSNSVSCGQL